MLMQAELGGAEIPHTLIRILAMRHFLAANYADEAAPLMMTWIRACANNAGN